MNKRGKTIMMLCLTVLLLGAYSVKAAGNNGYSTTLELTGGESWKLISSCENTPHELVTGAGFQDERTGFLSCRYTQDAGPVLCHAGRRKLLGAASRGRRVRRILQNVRLAGYDGAERMVSGRAAGRGGK